MIEFIQSHWILYTYIYGWLVCSPTFIERRSALDIAASYIVGLLWSILIPSMIIKKITH